MTINQRIKILVKELESGKQKAFAEKTGLTPSMVGSYMPDDENKGKRVSEPGYEGIMKILASYPQLRIEWLMFGQGDMLKSEQESNFESRIPEIVTVDSYGEENIVLVETKAQGGYLRLMQKPEFYKDLPVMKIPSAAFRNGTFRAFEVEGDSMSPTLHHGAIVIGRYEDNWERGNIKEGYIYVVVTRDHVVVKRVLNRLHQGHLYLMSDNEGYEGYPVDKENILQLWRLAGGLINKFPNTRYDWRRKMSHMEADIFDLQQKVNELMLRLSQ